MNCIDSKDGDDENIEILRSRISEAESLLPRSESLTSVPGYKKLGRKLKAEIKFLKQLQERGNFTPEHLFSSNLGNLAALIKVASNYDGEITELFRPVKYSDDDGENLKQNVDIVADDGKTWIKVIARNPFALERVYAGDASYGVRTIVDQAKDLLTFAQHNLHVFVPPSVVFHFHCGVTDLLSDKLLKLGISVEGETVESRLQYDVEDCVVDDDQFDASNKYDDVDNNCFNLDVSTLIAYVSSLTNGGSDFRFKESILQEEADAEKLRPVKPILDELFKNKKLFCCQTAVDDFRRILECVGGPGEISRAEQLLPKISVIPDRISDQANKLCLKGKIRERSQIIFGTGDSFKFVTVTANSSFVRATAVKGVKFAVIVHEARALTERKQRNVAA